MNGPALSIADFHGSPRRVRTESVFRGLFFLAALLSIVISGLIVASLLSEAISFISNVDIPTLWSSGGWFPRRGYFDVKTIVVGSLLVTVIGMLIAVPLGLGTAIYLAEYARPKIRRILKPALEMLAGIPSVVVGVFALTWISPELVRRFFDATLFNLVAAGIGVGILTVPLVASISEDAMRAVPQALREAAYGMGARKVTTSIRVVIPAAVSGLVAAFIVAVSRAIGETMVVAIAAGGTGGSRFTTDVLGPGQTMTAAMAALASGTDQVTGSGNAFQSLFFVGLLLFSITLGLNIVAERFVRRVRQRY
ncbi:MAG: phosphate ABC transporter permease subunit PstC [Acidimicrobiales bacterium]